jgi:hypothetical protein
MRMLAFPVVALALSAPLSVSAAPAPQQSSGYGYGGGGTSRPQGQQQPQQQGYGYGSSGQTVNGVPPGVGYNNQGGEMSRQASERAALAPEYNMHMVGPTAAQGVGSGGGPQIAQGGQMPGYVQAKFVTPYGNAAVIHHYGPGYPPPIGSGGGPNDGNASGMGASGSVAGNPDMVNWGLTPAQTREELGNGVWFGGAAAGTASPVPYVGSFND